MPNQANEIQNNYSSNHQIDDLIGVPPNWLLRSGITIVFIVVSIILTLAAIIKYPEKIVANGIMTSKNPPIEHFNTIPGIVEDLHVKNGDYVEKNQPLLYIKNNVNKTDLSELVNFIEKYKTIDAIPNYLALRIPPNLQLGELQNNYSQLELAFSQFQLTLKQSGVFTQISTLNQEIQNTKQLRRVLLSNKEYSKEEMALIERDFNRNVSLNKEGVISDFDKEKIEADWVRYKKQYSFLDQGIIENKIREDRLILETQQLIEGRASKVQTQLYDITQHINLLESNIQTWEKKYFIKSEINGEVSLSPTLVEDNYIDQNTNLLSIIPSNNSNKKLIQAYVPDIGIGKIKIKDKVIVKVGGYPYKEFGVLTSAVEEISEIPENFNNQNGERIYVYSINALLPERLMTNHQKEIPYRPNSSVNIEIITEDKSILERLFETLLSLKE